MYEVEVKVEAAHSPVRARLAELEAERVGRVEQRDTYYDAPHREFAETDEALRMRCELDVTATDETDGPDATEATEVTEATTQSADGTTKVTYKGPLVESASKTREEFETGVDDGEEMDRILAGLGFDPAAHVEKRREFYAFDGYTVTLDSVVDLGEFVEVEREATAEEVDEVREGAFAVLRELGLDPDDQIRTSYLGLLLENSQE